jgi:hypothetical protein
MKELLGVLIVQMVVQTLVLLEFVSPILVELKVSHSDSYGCCKGNFFPSSIQASCYVDFCSLAPLGGTSFDVALMSRIAGPLIWSSGAWFLRYLGGTPQTVTFTHMQIRHEDTLHIAIPYPSGTTFNIYSTAPPWCNEGTCRPTPACRSSLVLLSVGPRLPCFEVRAPA